MAGSIFLETNDGLIEMTEQKWDAEERLQELIARYPNMLAGEQMNEAVPRRWLLVSREFGIPGELDAAGRWSLDHLYLDQDAIPTLVEVKRSQDTRIRREVVGQMFDYASHLVTNVSGERIRQTYEANLADGIEAADAVTTALGPETDVEGFWQRLNDNIAANKLRLVFLADEFPAELRRIVEFLNRQMQQTDVFAVEVRQYVSPDGVHRTLVPRLVGKVETKVTTGGGSGPGPRWDVARFDASLGASHPELIAIASDLRSFGVALTNRDVEWGSGRERGSFTARIVENSRRVSLFSVYTTGEVSINVGWYYQLLGTLDPVFSERIRHRVNEAMHREFSQQAWERSYPMMPLSLVAADPDKFKAVVTEIALEVRDLVRQPASQ